MSIERLSTLRFINMLINENTVTGAVLQRVVKQQEKGLDKYGELINLDSYTVMGWLEHKLEEQTDEIIYTEAVKQSFTKLVKEYESEIKILENKIIDLENQLKLQKRL